MARLLKNPQIAPGAQAAALPIVPSSAYGDSPTNGLIRFNATTNKIEFYYNGAWSQVAKIGSVAITVDDIVGDGIQTVFSSMSQAEADASAVVVTIGGVYQQPNVAYTMNGTTSITFTSAPPAPSAVSPNRINIIHNLNSTNAV
jgi:hypothetical protein